MGGCLAALATSKGYFPLPMWNWSRAASPTRLLHGYARVSYERSQRMRNRIVY